MRGTALKPVERVTREQIFENSTLKFWKYKTVLATLHLSGWPKGFSWNCVLGLQSFLSRQILFLNILLCWQGAVSENFNSYVTVIYLTFNILWHWYNYIHQDITKIDIYINMKIDRYVLWLSYKYLSIDDYICKFFMENDFLCTSFVTTTYHSTVIQDIGQTITLTSTTN